MSDELSEPDETMHQLMVKVRDIHTRMAGSLPLVVDVHALGVRSKIPFMVLSLREALIWRTEELARDAIGALDRTELSVAAILIRAIMENSALLSELVDLFGDGSLTDTMLGDRLTPMMFGSREWDDGPAATNIMTFIKKAERKIPGYLHMYESLSEYAHPNWKGVSMLFSRIDYANHVCNFGRHLNSQDKTPRSMASSLIASMLMFELLYNSISNDMPAYLEKLEKI